MTDAADSPWGCCLRDALFPIQRGQNQPIDAKIQEFMRQTSALTAASGVTFQLPFPPPLPLFYFILNCNIKLRRSAHFYKHKLDSLFVKKLDLERKCEFAEEK